MSTLLCFGLGYSAEHFVAAYGDGFERIIGTVRGAERAAARSGACLGSYPAASRSEAPRSRFTGTIVAFIS